jgi:hypothetical protein
MNYLYQVWFKELHNVRNKGRYLFLDVSFKLTGPMVSFIDSLFDDQMLAKDHLVLVVVDGLMRGAYMFAAQEQLLIVL